LQKDRQGKSTVQHLELILVMTPSFFLFLASTWAICISDWLGGMTLSGQLCSRLQKALMKHYTWLLDTRLMI
jgi:hypothetical protein